MQRNTIAEIARLAGVNSSTVSRALNPKTAHLISQKRREQIIDLCNQLNYRPKNAARSCASGKSYSIGFISGRLAIDMDSPFFSNYISGICNELQKHGYSLTMISAEPGNDDYQSSVRDILLSDRADGYIIGSVLLEKQTSDIFFNTGHPIVTTSRNHHFPAENISGVEVDEEESYAQIWQCMPQELLTQKFCFAGTHTKSSASDMEKIKITLDATLPPSKNAQKYFKTYNKHKRAKEILSPMAEHEQREIEYVDSVLCSIALAESVEDLKEIEVELIELGLLRAPAVKPGAKKKEIVTPFREYEFDGVKIYAGRNNLQNDRLLRLASPDDIWLHTQKYHSSHVIIAIRGGQVCDELLLYAAEICAYYSDGRDGDKIPVDYCKRKFVKKPSKSKAGFVTYTDYKTILVKPNAHKE